MQTRISHSLYPSRGPACGSVGFASCEQIAEHCRNATPRKACCEHFRPTSPNAKQFFVASALERGCVWACRHLEKIVCNMLFCVALGNASIFRLQLAKKILGVVP